MSVLIKPGSPEHAGMMSPSKFAAVLGVSRYESPYRLWHRMKGLVPPEPPKDIFRAGHAMEHALAHLWKEENEGWQLSPGEVQIRRDDLGFPAVATLDRRARRGGGSRRIVEFKTARELSEWGDDFTDDAPVDYIVQVIGQQIISGYSGHPAHLMVMGPFFNWHTYSISYDKHVAAAIIDRCAEFWRSLESDTPPLLDDSVATYECVRALHPDIDGTEIQIDREIADEYLDADLSYKAAKTRLTGAKTTVLDRMKKAQVAWCGDVKVAGRQNNGHGSISLVAKHPKKKKGSAAA